MKDGFFKRKEHGAAKPQPNLRLREKTVWF